MSHKQKIYDLLKDGEFHSFRELNNICFRYGARLHDLKKEGIDHEIMTIKGIKWYRLLMTEE